MKEKDKVLIEAILFTAYCLIIVICISILPLARTIVFCAWIPCGLLNGYVVQRHMEKQFGPKDYFKGTNNLALLGLSLSGTLGFLVIPILFRLRGFKQ